MEQEISIMKLSPASFTLTIPKQFRKLGLADMSQQHLWKVTVTEYSELVGPNKDDQVCHLSERPKWGSNPQPWPYIAKCLSHFIKS